MNIILLILGIVSGICAGIGLIYLFIGLRRRGGDRLHILFGLFSIAYSLAIATSSVAYKTTSLDTYMFVSRWGGVFTLLTLTLLLWFVAEYTDVRPRYYLIGQSVVFIPLMLVALFRENFVHTDIFGIVQFPLPWGESVTLLDANESIWEIIFFLSQFAVIGFVTYACVRQFLRGKKRDATILGVGLIFLIFALIFDMLFIDSGILNFIYLGDFAFVPLAIVMSIYLANQVIKTEELLASHQARLEQQVEERTAELKQSNTQMTNEIAERKRVEQALRHSERQARALLNAPPDTAMLLSPEGIILEINEIGAELLGLKKEQTRGKNAFNLFDKELAQLRREKAALSLASKQVVRWEDERDGKHYANNLYPILDEDEVVTSLAVFSTDITGRKKVEEALHHRIADLNVLNQIGQLVVSAMDMPVALQRIAEIISGHYQARYSHIILQEDVEDELMVLVGFDRESGVIKPTNLDISLATLPLVYDVMTTGESLVISDPRSLSSPPDVRDFLQEHHIQGIMLIPLRIIGAVSGILVVSHDQPGRSFTRDEVLLVETIADDVSRTIEIARIQEQEKKTAAAEERSRLARDLHDAVTQTIYAASLIAESLPVVWERNPEEGFRNLTKLRQLVRGALAEMRSLLFELRPSALDAADLQTLIVQLGDALTGRTRIPVDVNIQGDSNPPVDVKLAFYRIAQESFNNIAKHAEANQVFLDMRSDPDYVKLSISDNGRGFDLNDVPEDKLGLSIMSERAEEVGADLEVISSPGQGTQVTLTWHDRDSSLRSE